MDMITRENILAKLKSHPRNETPQVCMIAGQEIELLRRSYAEAIYSLNDLYKAMLCYEHDADGDPPRAHRAMMKKASEVLDKAERNAKAKYPSHAG